jgi:hypothetical protein
MGKIINLQTTMNVSDERWNRIFKGEKKEESQPKDEWSIFKQYADRIDYQTGDICMSYERFLSAIEEIQRREKWKK